MKERRSRPNLASVGPLIRYPDRMRRVCFFHAGCPDGLGAAWAVRQAWGSSCEYRARGHEEVIDTNELDGVQVVYVDFAPSNDEVIELAETAAQVVILDHHVSSRDRIQADPAIDNAIEGRGHYLHFDLEYSGAVLAWNYFSPDESVPDLLQYVQDQDLWSWKLPNSHEVNAAIGSYPLDFDTWDALARTPAEELARQGEPIVRSNRTEIQRALHGAACVWIEGQRVEAVNATTNRSSIGHELAKRAAYGPAWGCVYRVTGDRVTATLYSIGDVDVSQPASRFDGGGHRNAAGFSVPLRDWLGMLN